MRLFSFLVISYLLLAINTHADKVYFQGQWNNGPQDTYVTYPEDIVTHKVTSLKASINPVSRRFEFVIDVDRPTVLQFQNQSILVMPGDTVDVDVAGSESHIELNFRGHHGSQHSFLIRLREAMGVFLPADRKIDEPSLEKYKVSATHHYDSSLLFLMNDVEQFNASKKFQKFAQGYLTAVYYANLLYPVSSGIVPKDNLPPYYFELVDFSFFKSADFLGFQEFASMLSQYNDYYYSSTSSGNYYDSASVALRIKSANHNFFGEIKDNLLLAIFSGLTKHGTEINALQIQTLYEYLTGVFGENRNRVAEMQSLKYSYDIINKPLPLKVLEQELKTTKGKTISLAQVLAVNEVVYIDFWATWCGQCMHEMPAQQQLVTELEGRQVKFISISFDNDEKKWQKTVSKMKVDGDHFIITEGFSSAIAQYIPFDEIPRYIILDREGRLINRKALGPSSILQNKFELLSLVE